MAPKVDIYGGRSPLELPAYSIKDAARYLQLPKTTVRQWALGRTYPVKGGKERRTAKPVIIAADPANGLLSFINLVEIHVLSAVRRQHGVKLPKIRKAVAYLRRETGDTHPLAFQDVKTDRIGIFVERLGKLVDASAEGQLVMREMVSAYLRRIDRDARGIPIRLFPFTNARLTQHKPVVIDPTVQFGRPVIAGTGIPTEIVAQRHKAGDTIAEIAADYGRPPAVIEEALRYEAPLEAAG
jgi:uncharacterized protein (DUF433 family)